MEIIDTVYGIKDGRVERHTTSEILEQFNTLELKYNGYKLTFRMTELPDVARCWRGTCEEIARLAHRICPFATVIIAPEVDGMPSARGEAFAKDNLILLRMVDTWTEKWIQTFFHEVWHICSKKLPAEMYDLCAELVKGTPEIGNADYYDRLEERLARMFAHWAMSVWMGWQSVTDDPRTVTSPSSIFAGIYSGYFAEVVAGRERAA